MRERPRSISGLRDLVCRMPGSFEIVFPDKLYNHGFSEPKIFLPKRPQLMLSGIRAEELAFLLNEALSELAELREQKNDEVVEFLRAQLKMRGGDQ